MRPLGEFAFQFLKRCRQQKQSIIVSDIVRKELLDYYSCEKVEEVFASFLDITIEVIHSKEQAKSAINFWKKNKRFPLGDILHSIIARDNRAILITRDKHFEDIGLVEQGFPEEY